MALIGSKDEIIVVDDSLIGVDQQAQHWGEGVADWLLPVPDEEAEAQTVETELSRLWTLKSYLALDSDEEASFEHLCQQACHEFEVPVSAITLIDLGRQFCFASYNSSTLLSNNSAGNSLPPRNTPRQHAFCAHAILSRSGMCVVNDTLEDARFRCNPMVVEHPFLRFYAGVPLISPEGYKLGAFCLEGPDPKPQGLSLQQVQKLHSYAQKAVNMLVQRKQRLVLQNNPSFCISSHGNAGKQQVPNGVASGSVATVGDNFQSPRIPVDMLQRYAGTITNLAGLVYYEGDCVTAMCLLQESIQTLMLLEEHFNCNGKYPGQIPHQCPQHAAAAAASTTSTCASAPPSTTSSDTSQMSFPTIERYEEMTQLYTLLSAGSNTAEVKTALCAIARKLFVVHKQDENVHNQGCCGDRKEARASSCTTVDGFPGLFGLRNSKLRGMDRLYQSSNLVFPEPFRIAVNDEPGREREQKHFLIPLEQCAKASLFNMGLIHYHWGRVATSLQFFDLAVSMSRQKLMSPLAFDPVILAALNNMAQLHLQQGRTSDAMALLQDALSRGSLTALYGNQNADWISERPVGAENGPLDARKSRRLRRKLTRTVMNLGHVHFVNCEYKIALATCHEALRMTHSNADDIEVGAIWHNMGTLMYHQGDKESAVQYLDKFLGRGKQVLGPDHLQLAEAYALQGLAIFEMGNLYDCMLPLNEALRIRRSKLESNHIAIAESLCAIGRVLQAREEYDFCLRAFFESVAIHRTKASNMGTPPSFEMTQTLLEVGRALHAQSRINEAIEIYQEVLDLTGQFFGKRHLFVARLLNILGNLYLEANRVDLAMTRFIEATSIQLEHGLAVDHTVAKNPLCCVKHVGICPNVAPMA
ncbi:hypothetical protein ACA910_012378 [Epithemia clementina (nom. ined.)]